MKKRIVCLGVSCILAFGCTAPVFATTVDEVKKEQKTTQKQISDAESRIQNIAHEKDAVAQEITVLDTQLVDILTSISICEDEIAAKEDEIDVAKDNLKAAEEKEHTQCEDMKTRIRFMYEKGDQAYLEIFLEAGTLPEMLNKASYVEQLYAYDRALLQQYQDTKEEIADLKEELELEEADLLTSRTELKEQQDYMENVIAEKKATVANFDSQLARARSEVSVYKQQLQEQNSKIKQLEKEAEEARKAAKKKKKEDAAKEAKDTPDKSKDAPRDDKDNSPAEDGASIDHVDDELASDGGYDEDDDAYEEDEDEEEPSGGSDLGRQIANYGCKFIGCPYVYGGTSLTNGTDCSGFTQAVYAHFGISIPRDSTSQRFIGKGVDYADACPGDIVCYAGHVGLYIGNGQIVHASTERTGIKISNATYRTILAVRRVV